MILSSHHENQKAPKCNNQNSMKIILISLLCISLSFMFGTMSGLHRSTNNNSIIEKMQREKCSNKLNNNIMNPINMVDNKEFNDKEFNDIVERRVKEELAKRIKERKNKQNDNRINTKLFEKENNLGITGAARMKKKDFMNLYDFGNPNHPDDKYIKDSDGLIFYSTPKSYPSTTTATKDNNDNDEDEIPLLNVEDALQNCNVLNVINNNGAQCIAIHNYAESFHLQKFMRVGEHGTKLSKSYPLTIQGRARTAAGTNVFRSPDKRLILDNFANLRQYLNTKQDVINELTPIVQRIVKDNTIIVLTCNLGQVDLLMNFVCSAKSKHFDISNVLLFATDKQTYDIGIGLGLAVFYDESNFGNLPTAEARSYGDRTFTAMMYAKVVTVQTINMLGYDVLFQDVDIIWYNEPLTLFHDKNHPNYDFDCLFSRDGATTVRYAPYDANSGFYYIRYNERTKYMLISLLYAGDLIQRLHSHQAALQSILAEHSSLFGLKVKTLTEEEFPGGHYFHKRDQKYMKSFIKGEENPFIFHMCWTRNKDDKLKYMKQMGWWYLNLKCNDPMNVLRNKDKEDANYDMVSDCCASQAIIECFYRDKPSVIPCKDSPPIDKGRPSFW